MADISTVRHDEVFNARQNNSQITIIGAGAIGSRVFAALVELGLTKIRVIDFDNVEAHNLANQIFNHSDIGKPKVEACADWYKLKTGYEPPKTMEFINAKLPCDDIQTTGTVFLLTDSMVSRREIFESCIRGNLSAFRVIEVRMASTHGNVHVFSPLVDAESKAWIDTLIDDDLAEVSACGSSLTVGTTASILANAAVWQFMHSKTDEAALDTAIDVFLKPMVVATRSLYSEQRATATTETDDSSEGIQVQRQLNSDDQNVITPSVG